MLLSEAELGLSKWRSFLLGNASPYFDLVLGLVLLLLLSFLLGNAPPYLDLGLGKEEVEKGRHEMRSLSERGWKIEEFCSTGNDRYLDTSTDGLVR